MIAQTAFVGKTATCLNPCCNGIYLMILQKAQTAFVGSLNPCCNGIYLMINNGEREYSSLSCLNPCCNGIYLMITRPYWK